MCDGDGQTILGPQDPHQFQQSAANHGHLGDFHFVFRKSNQDASDLSDDNDREPDIFGTMPQQIKHGKYPAARMEKHGKNHKAWRRRYFVLIDNELLYYKRRDVYEHKKDPIARIELVNPPRIIKLLPPESIRKNGGQIQNYNDMIFWVKALSKRNEPNEFIDGLETLIQNSELLHSNDDELIVEKFSNLEIILNGSDSADSYHRYLQSEHRRSLRKDIEGGLITRHMFNDIKCDIFDYLNSNEYFRLLLHIIIEN